MKKNLIALAIAALLAVQCVPVVGATEFEVPTDMLIKKSASSTFVNGPIQRTAETVVDFKAVIDTEALKEQITARYQVGVDAVKAFAGDDAELEAEAMAKLAAGVIKNEFTVTIEYPAEAKIPAEYLADSKSMLGFNEAAKLLFTEVSRTASGNKLTIKIHAVEDGVDGITMGKLMENLEAGLTDLEFTVEGVTFTKAGEYTVIGSFEGYTEHRNADGSGVFEDSYNGKQTDGFGEFNGERTDISATVTIKETTGGGGGSSTRGGRTDDKEEPASVTLVLDGQEFKTVTGDKGVAIDMDTIVVPERQGYRFSGWYYDPSCTTNPVPQGTKVTGQTKVYGQYISEVFDNEQHLEYIHGYPDGTFKAGNGISREEVATIFYRLLRAEVAEELAASENKFTDVEDDRWSNKAISTIANGEYIKGYSDGTFKPEALITRAEFATIVSRFASLTEESAPMFTDLEGHWAESDILKIAEAGYAKGYSDGKFDPDGILTRAEAVTIINRMLGRSVDSTGVHEDAITFSDIKSTDWFYYDVLESANSHTYTRTGDALYEIWDELLGKKIN